MKCFLYAARGIGTAIRTERNLRIHLAVAFYVTAAGLTVGLSPAEWAAALLCIGLVISLELVNTALEHLCDQVTEGYAVHIKHAKDCAAGAVLWAALLSAAAGCILFFTGGRPAKALAFAASHPAVAGVLILLLPVWLYFIFHKRSIRK